MGDVLKSRTRGLDELEVRLGDVTAEIRRRSSKLRPLRVLEIGFGHGVAMLEILRRLGGRIEMHAINKSHKHGDWDTMRAGALERGIFTEAQFSRLQKPNLYYYDVSEGLRLPDDHFDFIYSQAMIIFVRDKIALLKEINRVLKPDGQARIDLMLRRTATLPPRFRRSIEIYRGQNRERLEFWPYIKPFDYVRKRKADLPRPLQVQMDRWFGREPLTVNRQSYLEMSKTANFDLKLELARAINLNRENPEWYGYQSRYKTTD